MQLLEQPFRPVMSLPSSFSPFSFCGQGERSVTSLGENRALWGPGITVWCTKLASNLWGKREKDLRGLRFVWDFWQREVWTVWTQDGLTPSLASQLCESIPLYLFCF